MVSGHASGVLVEMLPSLTKTTMTLRERAIMVKSSMTALAALAACTCLATTPARADTSSDEAAIKALEARFAAAFNAKDLDAIMKIYAPDVLVFDVIPPREYAGAKAYREDWRQLLAGYKGPIKFELSDLDVVVSGRMAFSHSIQRVAEVGAAPMTVRVTDVYRKIDGKWLIVHEHVSVPVDLATGKADLTSKP